MNCQISDQGAPPDWGVPISDPPRHSRQGAWTRKQAVRQLFAGQARPGTFSFEMHLIRQQGDEA